MTADRDPAHQTALSPHDSFAALANETRMEILQALGATNEPMAFSELREVVGVSDSGQFNYHLDKLVGHFVREADGGYELRQPGSRVVEAILSGAVTGAPELEPTAVDAPCIYCGGETEVSYRQERLLWRCTECPGRFADHQTTSEAFGTLPHGTIDLGYLPAAGVQNRSPRELLEAADVWSAAEDVAMTNGVCPRCSGAVEESLSICEDHDEGDGVCDRCQSRLGATVRAECTNCTHVIEGSFLIKLMADPTFRSVFDSRGIDVIATPLEDKAAFVIENYELLETDPFRARITHTIDDEEVSLIVDDRLAVETVIE